MCLFRRLRGPNKGVNEICGEPLGRMQVSLGKEVIHLFSEDGDAIFCLAHFLGMGFDFLKAKFCFQGGFLHRE